MIKPLWGLSLIGLLGLSACGSGKTVVEVPTEEVFTEERILDTLYVSADRPEISDSVPEPSFERETYRASQTRPYDLLHTSLALRFNWEKEQVIGKATLTLSPFFYETDQLTLDAKGFQFKEIRLGENGLELAYQYENGKTVDIQLDRTYSRTDTFKVFIDYIATPSASGGSAAITSDKGLFFINPRGEEKEKPRQIWTQGETEHNSRWFPTFDQPNERCTQELVVTVEDHLETLSNGLLVKSEKNEDGTRTDYWKMDLPHAPYLFMLAVGDFALVEETWRDIPVQYYVEPEFEEHARAIFPYTTEMLEFFSEQLGVDYPWSKYAQVVVRDYVSGAMENTTAVIFGEFMQKPERELIDELTNEKVVAHEMYHHWFGDLVTCESWSNLTMNEGFANYSEYLWLEYKYGRDEADYHLLSEWAGYMGSAQGRSAHPLIWFGFDDKEDMFDAHSYNKGGSVLHMLRNYVGDEAFFAALRKYLNDNAYSDVEVHELRLAFEDVTGEDLNWFFNQWYFSTGHPMLDINYGFDSIGQEAIIEIEQIQDPALFSPVFELRVPVDIYQGGKKRRHMAVVDQRKQTLRFPVEGRPDLIIFDADRTLLAQMQDNKTADDYVFQFYHAPRFLDRFDALSALLDQENEWSEELFQAALKDEFWSIRLMALETLSEKELTDELATQLRTLALEDPHSAVRSEAIYQLGLAADPQFPKIAKEVFEKEPSYLVIGETLEALSYIDQEEALELAKELENIPSGSIRTAVGYVYLESGDQQYLPYFESNFNKLQDYDVVGMMRDYQELASGGEIETAIQAAQTLKAYGVDQKKSIWHHYGAALALSTMRNNWLTLADESSDEARKAEWIEGAEAVTAMLKEMAEKETDPQLKQYYRQLQLIP